MAIQKSLADSVAGPAGQILTSLLFGQVFDSAEMSISDLGGSVGDAVSSLCGNTKIVKQILRNTWRTYTDSEGKEHKILLNKDLHYDCFACGNMVEMYEAVIWVLLANFSPLEWKELKEDFLGLTKSEENPVPEIPKI